MKKALVADGSVSGRELLRILLEHEGFQVIEVAAGREVLEVAREVLPDIILLDIEHAAIDSYSGLREMRLDGPLKDRAILAVIGNLPHGDRERLMALGFSGYVTKPLVLSALRQQLAQFTALPAD